MNKRKRVALAKHRRKAKKLEERQKALPPNLRQAAKRRQAAGANRGA